jgi:secretion/DNA translocation related CpaE-like protein
MGIAQDREGPSGGGWLPEEGTVFCITSDGILLEECARVAAVAGVRLKASSSFADAGREWDSGGLLLLGADVGDVPPRRGSDTVLVGRGSARELMWRRAGDLGVEHVAELPDAAAWLVDFLGRRRRDPAEGLVLGVLGGCGGAGTTTTASLLAAAAADRGRSTVLVDGDRLGFGLELGLAEEPLMGLKWPDLASASGSIDPTELDSSLPRVGGVPVLSWPASTGASALIGSTAIARVLDAARQAFDLVVIDVGRGREGLEDFAWASDRLLLVVPARLGATLAASRLLDDLPPVPVEVLVRGRLAEGVDAEQISAAVGCPLGTHLPELRGASAAGEAGRLLELARRRPVRRMADDLLGGLLGEERPGRVPPHGGSVVRHSNRPTRSR